MHRPKCSDKYEGSSRRTEGRPNVDIQRCRQCDCKITKETGKSRSRVWKKVMWFTRKSKNSKLDSCQCECDVELDSQRQPAHSNSWSFTQTASKRFRISSRRRRCKSENVKKTRRAPEASWQTARSETRPTGASRTASPTTATGNFCDFGTSSLVLSRTSGKSSQASLLSGIARELNPPANAPLGNVNCFVPANQLSKSHSSASFSCTAIQKQDSLSRKGVRRWKSFPGPFYNTYHSKRRKVQQNDRTSPPLKHKQYGLRRTVTFSGKLNTEFATAQIRKTMSANNTNFTKKGSASLGEIQDQDGSIIGIVHFYKSPKNNCIQQKNNHGLRQFGTMPSDICESCKVQRPIGVCGTERLDCVTCSNASHSSPSNSGNNEPKKFLPFFNNSSKNEEIIDPQSSHLNDLLTQSSLSQNFEKSVCDKNDSRGTYTEAAIGISPIARTCVHLSQRQGEGQNEFDVGKAPNLTESEQDELLDSTTIPELHHCKAQTTQMDLQSKDFQFIDDSFCDFHDDSIDRNQSSFDPVEGEGHIETCTKGIPYESDSHLYVDDIPEYASLGQNDTVNKYCMDDNLTKNIQKNQNVRCVYSNKFSARTLADDTDSEAVNKFRNFKEDNSLANDHATKNETEFLSKDINNDSMSLEGRQSFDKTHLPESNKTYNVKQNFGSSAMEEVQNIALLNLADVQKDNCITNQEAQVGCAGRQIKDTFLGSQECTVSLACEGVATEKINGLEYCLESAVELNYIWNKVTLNEGVKLQSLECLTYNIEPTDVAYTRHTIQVLESSSTSDYASCSDEDMSNQNDMSINIWKTSTQPGLKDDDVRPPVPGKVFKMRTELMLGWFEEFNDEQKNIVIKKLLDHCDLPQMHLLSVAMEPILHKSCPPNCQDMLVWLPYTVTLKILLYLDAVSLCQCNQVNRAWNELTNNQLLWQHLTRNPDYQLSEASSMKQLQKYTQSNGAIHWKKVLAERFLLQRNWLNGKYTLKTFNGHNQGIACVQFDDTRIVSGSSDKTIKLWDISNTTSELMLTLAGHSGTVRCLDLNGNRLVSGSTDRTIKVWDLSFASYWAGASCKVTMVGHLHTVRCLQADEKKLVSGSYDKTVKVWNLKTGQCQLTLRGHTAAVLCVQFDDQKIVSGSYDKKIKVWDLREGSCLMTLDGHHDAVTCLNLTHDGMKIITGSLDYSLKFWDLYTGKCYGTLDWITSEGHTAVVRCLQVDSWRIISGGDDKTLKVWELATGQRLLTLRYHSDGVTCMQFNDFAIVSGSYDRTVKLWDFTPKHPYLESDT